MADIQQRRIAINETRFREANEHIRSGIDGLRDGEAGDGYSMMCECALAECEEMIRAEQHEYRHVRSDPAWFMVRPTHVVRDVELPVEKNERFWIIEKFGMGRAIAQADAAAGDG